MDLLLGLTLKPVALRTIPTPSLARLEDDLRSLDCLALLHDETSPVICVLSSSFLLPLHFLHFLSSLPIARKLLQEPSPNAPEFNFRYEPDFDSNGVVAYLTAKHNGQNPAMEPNPSIKITHKGVPVADSEPVTVLHCASVHMCVRVVCVCFVM